MKAGLYLAFAFAAIELLAAGRVGHAAEGEKVCVAYHSSAATFNVVDREGKAARAAELGVEIVQADATEDADKQTQQIRDFVTAGCTGLIVQAVDATATAVAVEELGDAPIPIITGDRFVDLPYGGPTGANPKVHVGWSDFERGKLTGAVVVRACEGKDPCRVILEEGTAGSAPQIEITRGIEAAIADHPNISIVDRQNHNFDPAQAVTVTEALLTKHRKGEIEVIVSHDDNRAIAALEAAEGLGRTELAVVGSGGSKAATDAIAEGRMYGTSKISPTDYGRLAVDTVVHLMRNEPITVVEQDGRPTVQMKLIEVTRENVAENPGEW
jgi:ribose transport system substrate-binding protein